MAAAKKKTTVVTPGFSPLYVLPGGTYDINKVYTESTDAKGHYEHCNVKFPPHVESMVMNALADNSLYRNSVQAFIRDAMIHRLWYLAHNPGATIDPVQMELEVMRQLMEQELEFEQRMQADVEKFLDVVETLTQNNAADRAEVYVQRMKDLLLRPELSEGHRELVTDALDQADEMMTNPRARRRRS